MILSCNFEELRALSSGADLLLAAPGDAARPSAAARAEIEALRPRLTGDLEVASLPEQRSLRYAVGVITDSLRERMDATILETHPAEEDAVLLYFDYAHSLTVLDRLDRMAPELAALEELMNGAEV